MTSQNTSKFVSELIKEGIDITDAEFFDKNFANNGQTSDEFIQNFIAGWKTIGEIAGLVNGSEFNKRNFNQPSVDPWKKIFQHLSLEINNGVDPSKAWGPVVNTQNGLFSSDFSLPLMNVITKYDSIKQSLKDDATMKKLRLTKHYKDTLKALGYTFRMRMLDNTIEANNEPLQDHIEAKIINAMTDRGFQANKTVRVISELAGDTQYHPIREYLDGLTYDGGDYIQTLGSYFNDQYGMFSTWIRKWLIGAVAKVYEAEQNPMLVLDGRQGIGKSEFARWLASPMREYFIEGPINTNDKDCEIRLISNWIWEVSELGVTTRKADYEALKAFLTTRRVTVRKPYGKHDINKPAMASFIGTINNSSGIFSDPTGSRRFLTSKLIDIVWDYAKDLTPDQVWSEAMAAYKDDEPWKLTPDEINKSSEINTEYDVPDPIEGLLKKFFDLDPTHDDWWIPTSDIVAVLKDPIKGNLRGLDKTIEMDLGKTMTRFGHESKRRSNTTGQQVSGYTGIRLLP